MKLSMWNLYYSLPYQDAVPMIKDGHPTITCARWIVTSYLNQDAVYVGSEKDYFDTNENVALVVHRHDMILVRNVEVEELFNEICCIIDRFMLWEQKLEACMDQAGGLQNMLDASRDILKNPAFLYAPDGHTMAITSGYSPSIHPHWKELLECGGLTDRKMKRMRQEARLSEIFLDIMPTRHDSLLDTFHYMHCSVFANNYMAGHLVLFDFLGPIEEGMEYLMEHLIHQMSQYIQKHFDRFSPTSRLADAVIRLISSQTCEIQELDYLLHSLNWREQDAYQFLVVQEKVEHEPVLLTKLYLRLTRDFPEDLIFRIEQKLVILKNRNRDFAEESLKNVLTFLTREGFLCGISSIFSGLRKCYVYYQQAEAELRRCFHEGLLLSRGDERGLAHYLEVLREDPLAEPYVNRQLLYLKNHDEIHHTLYYSTLKTYCLSGFQLSDTARILGIHRNSLSYRLERIRELIDFSFFDRLHSSGDEQERQLLYLSFLIIDYVLK